MDPETTLEWIIAEAEDRVGNGPDGRDDRLAEWVLELDCWLRRGGYLPKAWDTGRPERKVLDKGRS